MRFNADKFRAAIALESEAWTAKDATELAILLQNSTITKALAFLDNEAKARAFGLLTIDLTSQEGLAAAAQTQGFCRGVQRAIDLLCDLTLQEENADGPGEPDDAGA